MKILVTVKRVPDPETQLKINADGTGFVTDNVKWVVNPFDEIAIEEGLRLKEKHAGSEVVMVSIGPKAALGILGRSELPVMVRAIRGGDAALVATVPGIGRKTAERVILELRDRLESLTPPGELPAQSGPQEAVGAAVEGLVGLGFREPEARAAVQAVAAADGDARDVAELVGAALRRLDAAGSPR